MPRDSRPSEALEVTVLGCRMHPWTMAQTVAVIDHALDSGRNIQHGVVNVGKLMDMQQDPELNRAVQTCDIINLDGMGVVWAARLLGVQVPERVAGIDLFFEVLRLAERRGEGVFMLGATDEVLAMAAEELQRRFPQLRIAGRHHGYFSGNESAVVDAIRVSGASMLFVAITSPMKEQFIARYHERLGVRFSMGVGGTFDVVAGKVKRAPPWMQRAGLEGAFRVAQEPWRFARFARTMRQFFVSVLQELWARLRSKRAPSRSDS